MALYLFYMSIIAFLLIICCIAIYIIADISKKNRQVEQDRSKNHLKKKDAYLVECQLLTQMAKQKAEEISTSSKPKLSIHISTDQAVQNIEATIKQLTAKFKVYLIVDSVNQSQPVSSQIQNLIQPSYVFHCKSLEGEIAIIRQLNPKIHIETDQRIVSALKPYLNMIVTLNVLGEVADAGNIVKVNSEHRLLQIVPTLKLQK